MNHVCMAYRWRFMARMAGLVLLGLLLATGIVAANAAERNLPGLAFTLTLLHHNDGQSSLLADGSFGGVARFSTLVHELKEEARDPGNPEGQPGRRVRDLALSHGTVIVMDGEVLPGPGLNVATLDFLAGGGDQYPFGDASFTQLGIPYQQALCNYVEQDLDGVISADQYPEGGEGRIVILGY